MISKLRSKSNGLLHYYGSVLTQRPRRKFDFEKGLKAFCGQCV